MASRKNKALSLLKVILLIAVCLIIALIIVWPLWKFATKTPKVYTISVIGLIICAILWSIIAKIKKHVKK